VVEYSSFKASRASPRISARLAAYKQGIELSNTFRTKTTPPIFIFFECFTIFNFLLVSFTNRRAEARVDS
jgi:hypothetical protein